MDDSSIRRSKDNRLSHENWGKQMYIDVSKSESISRGDDIIVKKINNNYFF